MTTQCPITGIANITRFPPKFLARLQVSESTGCWNWAAAHDEHGYGRFKYNGKLWICSRLAWSLTNGDPGGLCVLHSCDNPRCVNPAHLFLGTKKDNSQDMLRKGRAHRQRDTRCQRGHAFDALNTGINTGTGRRFCKLCQKITYLARTAAA